MFFKYLKQTFSQSLFQDAPTYAKIYSDKSWQVIANGKRVIMKCSAVSNPVSTYTIYRNQKIVLNTSLTGEYVISSFSETDAGIYKCTVRNDVGSIVVGSVSFKSPCKNMINAFLCAINY